MGKTDIAWTDYVWNPVAGCTPISEGCAHCYAKRMAKRLAGRCGYPADEPFRVTWHGDRLFEPIDRKIPTRYFVCSMGDIFHEDVSDTIIFELFAVMRRAKQHKFFVLTKRPERLAELITRDHHPLVMDNVWMGVSVELQKYAGSRILLLAEHWSGKKFVSCEPLLGPVMLLPVLHMIDWVVCGAETGPGARPMNLDWARSLRDQCTATMTPFFLKAVDTQHNRLLDGETWSQLGDEEE